LLDSSLAAYAHAGRVEGSTHERLGRFQMITVGYDQAPVVAALRTDLTTSRAAVPASQS
jgi:PDZ domain-containing secreted protein